MQPLKLNTLFGLQCRMFSHPMWGKKSKRYFKPTYFDNVNYDKEMNWAAKEKRYRYKTQDPLFMDYDKLYLNQGVYPYIEKAKAVGRGIPINKRAYILYHMAKQNVYDPDFVIHME